MGSKKFDVKKLLSRNNVSFCINGKHYSVSVYLCHGWSITTVENLGNRFDGYGKLQARLAGTNGSQCGFCSPGMVMSMYSLVQESDKRKLTMKDVENSFGGNICRCTGYRPILDAFKSFCSDAPTSLIKKCTDIEDLLKDYSIECRILRDKNKSCIDSCANYRSEFIELSWAAKTLKISLEDNVDWYRVASLKEIFEILEAVEDNSYMIIHGNTAQGVYHPVGSITVFIDVNGVPELHAHEIVDNCLKLGANISLTNAMKFFYDVAEKHSDYFSYAKILADHIDLIATVPVRNAGSLAGNLSIKFQHREFPSDIFIILEMVGAQLVIEDKFGEVTSISLMEYLMQTEMHKKVITAIVLPPWNSSAYSCQSYKIMPRAQNAHAYVNAGFMAKIDKNDKCKVLEKPRIIFGGIRPDFVHASKTEEMMVGKQLLDPKHLHEILQVLSSELNPDHVLPDASPEFRKGLALSLFYKFVLSLSPDALQPKYRSGGSTLVRPLSSGQQDYQTDQKMWPLTKPVQKLEALCQCSGEAQYVNDIPNIRGELYGALIIATEAVASSFSMDIKHALTSSGVVALFSAKDIPGQNNFMNANQSPFLPDPVFADKKILYAGQPLGIVIAKTQDEALVAAGKVKVQYSGVSKPKIDFLEVITSGDKSRIIERGKIEPSSEKKNTKFKVEGKFTIKGQYHYTMETQTCLCVPVEDGMDVFPASQWPTIVQETISNVLNIPQNKINVTVKRLGGGYGAKISRNNQISAICALAAHLTRKPVHLTLNLETNMQMVGKRFPCHTEYEVGVDERGEIQYLHANLFQDSGLVPNEIIIQLTLNHFKNIYDSSAWTISGYVVRTDNPSNTWCRAPNSTEGVATIEHIMEHISRIVNKDPLAVRLANINSKENEIIPKMIDDIKQSSDFSQRLEDIETFNEANRWKKKGISLVPMNYPFSYSSQFHALVSIYGNDGTVAISHGGIEIGQGINTKGLEMDRDGFQRAAGANPRAVWEKYVASCDCTVHGELIAQVCAYFFQIPLEDVSVKQTMSIISANDSTTGGSITSEAVAYAVQQACKILLLRIEPIKKKLPSGSWKEIIKKAYEEQIDLTASYMYKKEDPLQDYSIYGVAVTEVETDILTGQYQILTVDILEDAGQSMSPYVDIGQLEGAFVMGLGYFTSEELIYNKNTGKLLTDRTWHYKPPGAKDIPIDFRIKLLKNVPNPVGVLGSKATGEPPLNLSVSVVFAIRNALESARKDSGVEHKWFDLDYSLGQGGSTSRPPKHSSRKREENPVTVERIWLSSLNNINEFEI